MQLKKTRIARLLLPQIDANSALLPPDRWILRTAYEFVKGNKSFHNTMGRAAIYAGGGLGAIIAGTVGAILLFPLALPMAAAGLAALGAALFAGFRAKKHFEKFKEETLPELRKEVGKKYLDYKMNEIKAAWQQKLEERRKKKAEAAAKPKPPEKQPQAKEPEEKKAEAVTPVTPPVTPNPQPAATTEKPATPQKSGEKKSLGSAFAEMAKKIAEERAKKLLEKKDAVKKGDDAAPKTDEKKPPQPETPKPPAPPQP
ncbi:MAG: hypothetical protein EPN97_05445 [Alphaproteobacteria bacterium]|nr:MAG: hypothetical protein EPN97_05445 [Alphaproteobacteria bacterium]